MSKTLVTWDLSQIECRATFYLAGEQEGLDLFAPGEDPYCNYGFKLFGRPIDKKKDPKERQSSKAGLLANGFAGGIGAGQRIGVNYKIDFHACADIILPGASPAELEEGHQKYRYYLSGNPLKPLSEREGVAVDILKQRYRKDFAKVTRYWDDLQNVFLYGGTAGLISVEVKQSGLRILTLPNGVQRFYHDVRIDSKGKYSYQAREGRENLWKGQLMENCAQALNEQISTWYRLRLDKIAPIVHMCYDEATHLVDDSELNEVIQRIECVLDSERPPFVPGLPIGFDLVVGKRYGK